MSKKRKYVSLTVFAVILALLLFGIFFTGRPVEKEEIGEAMSDAVLHEQNRVALFGLTVNPGLISAFTVTGVLFVFCLAVRLFVIPRFTYKPGKFQSVLETAVGTFSKMAEGNSPHRHRFLGAYAFAAGTYIFVSSLIELFGIQVVTTAGRSVSLPGPLSDINGAIAMGALSYGVILVGGIVANRARGLGALKDFSLPVSMSFRLFGALLSGALVTELVYHSIYLSFGLPVFVGVMFTLLDAVIQAYVLTTLTTVFYGESTEPPHKKEKKNKKAAKTA